MVDETERERAFALLAQHVAALGEYFECVQVLVSTSDGTGTRHYHHGQGNILAREAQARLWSEYTADVIARDAAEDGDQET